MLRKDLTFEDIIITERAMAKEAGLGRIEESAKRIAKSLFDLYQNDHENPTYNTFLEWVTANPPIRDLWLTLNPTEIFNPKKERIFTIASSLAFRPDGKFSLVPSNRFTEQEIISHKGLALPLLTVLAKAFTFDTILDSPDWVWLCHQLDAEQWNLALQKEGSLETNDIEIRKLLFNEEPSISNNDGIKKWINPNLLALVVFLNNNADGKNSAPSENLKKYIDKFLNVLQTNFGIRGNWLKRFKELLEGKTSLSVAIRDDFYLALIHANETYERAKKAYNPDSLKTFPIIVEIDWDRLVKLFPIYPFAMSDRPPSTIIPALHIPQEVVFRIWLPSSDYLEKVPENLRSLCEPLSSLSREAWLKGKDGNTLDPDTVKSKESDPDDPICSIRYTNTAPHIEQWSQILNNNRIALAPWTIYQATTFGSRHGELYSLRILNEWLRNKSRLERQDTYNHILMCYDEISVLKQLNILNERYY